MAWLQNLDVKLSERVLKHLKLECIELDANFQVKEWSQGAERFTGAALIVGQPIDKLLPQLGDSIEQLKAVRDGRQETTDFPLFTKQGDNFTIYYRMWATTYQNEGEQPGLICLIRDMTATQEQTNELKQQIEELKKQVDTLNQVKLAFFATAPHELRAPLTSVQSFIELVLEGGAGELNEEQSHFLTIAQNGVKRMLNLINDLLDIEQIESGNVKIDPFVFNLPNLVRLVIGNYLADLQREKIIINYSNNSDLSNSDLLVNADMGRIEQVLTNLITNAIKYNRPDGTIEISYEVQDDFLVTSIKDEGIGIAEKDQSKLFQRFYRASNAGNFGAKGNGLGLSISQVIIERHGGKIWLQSKLNQGSTFLFSLPLYRAEEAEKDQINE